ncbi:MAG: hypothetical protein ACLFWL_08240 [Candidatus Brocadiia bacterium]
MKRTILLTLSFLVPATFFFGPVQTVGLPGEELDDGLGDVAAELEEELGDSWWNKNWKFRRKVWIEDPRTKVMGKKIRLARPDPLLLFNTRPCASRLADLRALSPLGKQIECGVDNFGQDDGTSAIWVKLSAHKRKSTPLIYLYYANSKIKPPPAETDPPEKIPGRPGDVRLGPEETAPGYTHRTPKMGRFYRNLVVVEAEQCRSSYGKPTFTYGDRPPQMLWRIGDRGKIQFPNYISAGAYLASTCPWRPHELKEPIRARTTTDLPAGGKWHVHVRYKTSRPNHPHRRRRHRFVPFELRLNDKKYRCGVKQKGGARFRWDSFETELEAGKTEIGFRLTGMSGPDCVLFTKDEEYLPDRRDVNGPVWMRFKVLSEKTKPFYINVFCVIQPWSTHGPQGKSAGLVFRDRVIPGGQGARPRERDPETLLQPGEWSPWVRTLHSSMPTWWTHVSFLPGDKPPIGRYGQTDVEVTFQFASRPHHDRVFRHGTERTGKKRGTKGLHVLMPRRLDLNSMLDRTLTFTQWARQRYQRAQELIGGKTEGPEKIMVTTMATAQSAEATRYVLKTCSALGFNGIGIRCPLEREEFARIAGEHGYRWTQSHHWAPKMDLASLPLEPPEQRSCTEVLRSAIEEAAAKTYVPEASRWHVPGLRPRLIIMGDEIGPATSAAYINLVPLLKGAFHEYLRRHSLTPDFFGKKNWGEVEAIGYQEISRISRTGENLLRIQAALREEAGESTKYEFKLPIPAREEPPEGVATKVQETEDLPGLEEDGNDEEESAAPEERVKRASLEEKRLYHWTQRFRSFYTSVFYGIAHREIQRVAEEEMDLPFKPLCSPNFQASPTMTGQMWDGALNLFEWARNDTTNLLFHEDWINGPYRVAFGQRLLHAAARKEGQLNGHLIVADRGFPQRFMMGLAGGSRVFLSYLYGPRRVIGPPWAEDEPTVRAWGRLLSWTGRLEDQILSAGMRPADAALLVANTSEINTRYLRASIRPGRPLSARHDMFAALMDAHVPVEIVGEEEILDDDALKRYRVLYVSDPHVRREVQQKIVSWVRDGGVLWASHAGLARREYDVPSNLLDPVFGLADRGDIVEIKEEPSWNETIDIGGHKVLGKSQIKAPNIHPNWELDGAEVFGRFQDGSPAFIHNRFGKGHAFLFGNAPRACTDAYGYKVEVDEARTAGRKLLLVAAQTAGVRPHLQFPKSHVLWSVHDGRRHTVAYLANCRGEKIEDMPFEVFLPREPASAVEGSGKKLSFKWLENRVKLQIDLPEGDGKIIVLEY